VVQVIGIEVSANVLAGLAVQLVRILHMECRVRPERLDVSFAWDRFRNQYHSTAILQAVLPLAEPGARLLAVTSLDLYVPVLTFVFGEAQLSGPCAVLSMHRLCPSPKRRAEARCPSTSMDRTTRYAFSPIAQFRQVL
jgi:archaemetzincin